MNVSVALFGEVPTQWMAVGSLNDHFSAPSSGMDR